MKALLTMIALLTSFSASATIVRTNCTTEQFQMISSALASKKFEVTVGKELKNEVISVMQQEMGPTCKVYVQSATIGIPGRRTTKFELETGNATYTIVLGRQVEQFPTQWIELSKKSSW